jgi:hypothetical protein
MAHLADEEMGLHEDDSEGGKKDKVELKSPKIASTLYKKRKFPPV